MGVKNALLLKYLPYLQSLFCERSIHYNMVSYSSYQRKNAAKYFGVLIGKHSYGFAELITTGRVKSIGAFCSIASDVKIVGFNHATYNVTTHPMLYDVGWGFIDTPLYHPSRDEKVTIGNDVYIGQNVLLFPNITIGDGAVIGAGALVNRDVPDYAVVGGVPARVLKYRFDAALIAELKQLQWWKWSDEKIKNSLNLFQELSLFIQKCV